LKVQPGKTFKYIKLKIGEIKMKTKVCKVILMFGLVIGFGLCMLNSAINVLHSWAFNETSGNIAHDSCPDPINGILNGCASFLPGGEGVHLTASDDSYVSFGNSVGQFGTGDFTVTLEFKTSENKVAFDMVGNRTSAKFGNFFAIYMTLDGMVCASVCEDETGKNNIWLRSKAGFADGEWHTIEVNRSSNKLSLSIDGNPEKDGSAVGTANIKNGNEFKLGRSNFANWIHPANAIYKNLSVLVVGP
jgi:hypothetical protein